MLLPSALTCDAASQPRLQQHHAASASPFVSPPASPPTLSTQGPIGNIMSTCRSLQSLLTTPPPQSQQQYQPQQQPPYQYGAAPFPLAQLPTPPLTHAPPPLKLRLRPRAKQELKDGDHDRLTPRKRIVKRAPPRGANKRRRDEEDDMGRDDVDPYEEGIESDAESTSQQDEEATLEQADTSRQSPAAPSTPKRARIAPEQLPLGLERSDFHDVYRRSADGDNASDEAVRGTDVEVAPDGERWSAEDDRILVELVLDKLKLSKTEWQDCARSLGKDRHSVGRRWKSLILGGDVGLKSRGGGRRARLHSTWR